MTLPGAPFSRLGRRKALELSIADEIRVLSWIGRRPSTTAQLQAQWSKAPIELDYLLIVLRDEGAIAYTNGVWWRRGENGHGYSEK